MESGQEIQAVSRNRHLPNLANHSTASTIGSLTALSAENCGHRTLDRSDRSHFFQTACSYSVRLGLQLYEIYASNPRSAASNVSGWNTPSSRYSHSGGAV